MFSTKINDVYLHKAAQGYVLFMQDGTLYAK